MIEPVQINSISTGIPSHAQSQRIRSTFTQGPEFPLKDHIVLGDRKVSLKTLQTCNIQLSHGQKGKVVASGGFSTIYEFHLCPKSLKQEQFGIEVKDRKALAYKAEEKASQDAYAKKNQYHKLFPLSENGWLNSTVRNLLTWVAVTKLDKTQQQFVYSGVGK